MDHAQVKTSESEITKPERKRRAGIFPTVAALTGIGIAALTGCSPDAGATPEPTSTSAEASPSAEPTPVETETPIEELTIPENLVQYEAMSVEQFEALPFQERMPYISWLTRDEEEIAGLIYDETGNPQDQYTGPLSLNSSNQDIVTANGYNVLEAYVTHFNVNGIDGGSVRYDDNTARKILTGAYADTSSVSYFTRRGDLNEFYNTTEVVANPTGYIHEGGKGMGTALNEEIVTGTVEINGTEYPTRTLTTQTSTGNVYEVTYAYTEFTNYAGETEGTWAEVSRTDG
jgi:hypothetical protein